MAKRKDRPKEPTLRTWLVKLRGHEEPVEVEAEYRGAARHYAKSVAPTERTPATRDHYPSVEWCRLKRESHRDTHP